MNKFLIFEKVKSFSFNDFEVTSYFTRVVHGCIS